MAIDIVSLQIRDADGDVKSLPVYVGTGNTLQQLRDTAIDLSGFLDEVIDGVIESATITIETPVAGGLKTTAVVGSEVQRGALLSYMPSGTTYRFSLFIPTWQNAGFSGNDVNYTDLYLEAIDKFVDGFTATQGVKATDRNGNPFASFIEGFKKFRK
jgi:hypothetical protein